MWHRHHRPRGGPRRLGWCPCARSPSAILQFVDRGSGHQSSSSKGVSVDPRHDIKDDIELSGGPLARSLAARGPGARLLTAERQPLATELVFLRSFSGPCSVLVAIEFCPLGAASASTNKHYVPSPPDVARRHFGGAGRPNSSERYGRLCRPSPPDMWWASVGSRRSESSAKEPVMEGNSYECAPGQCSVGLSYNISDDDHGGGRCVQRWGRHIHSLATSLETAGSP